MEFMRNIIVTACILSVVITIAGNIKSGERFRKQLNVIFSLVFVSGVLGIAVKTGFDIELHEYTTEAYDNCFDEIENNANQVLKTEIESRTDKIIKDLLNKNNISFEKISSYINIHDDGSISFNRIDYKGDDFLSAEKLIKNTFKEAEVSRIE